MTQNLNKQTVKDVLKMLPKFESIMNENKRIIDDCEGMPRMLKCFCCNTRYPSYDRETHMFSRSHLKKEKLFLLLNNNVVPAVVQVSNILHQSQ